MHKHFWRMEVGIPAGRQTPAMFLFKCASCPQKLPVEKARFCGD